MQIYLRWVQYLLTVKLKDKNVVIVNMDETSLSGKLVSKFGVFAEFDVNEAGSDNVPQTLIHPWTCALKGVICSEASLMKHIPQVLLPKYRKRQSPPVHLKESYEQMGAPLQAWHKTSGWSTTISMLLWLRSLAHTLRTHAPDSEHVLLFDCAPTHVNHRVLQEAKRLRIHILVVPARCTWLLQPLDVYTYAIVKRCLRAQLARCQTMSSNGVVNITARLRVTGEVLQRRLISNNWSRQLQKVGLSSDLSMLNSTLKKVTHGLDLTPRTPSRDELLLLLGKAGKKSKIDWGKLLVDGVTSPDQPGKSSHSAAAAAVQPPDPPLICKKLGDTCKRQLAPSDVDTDVTQKHVISSMATCALRPITLRRWQKLPSASILQFRDSASAAAPSTSGTCVNFDVNGLPTMRVGPSAGTRKYTAQLKKAKTLL